MILHNEREIKMEKKDRKYRLFFGMRNYKFETHDENGVQLENAQTEEEWRKQIEQELEAVGASELFYVFHDKDVDDEDETVKKALHVHFVARFENPRHYSSILKDFGCEPRNFQNARSESSALLYLTHTTTEAIKAKKTRYNVQELHCIVKEENEYKKLTGDELEKFYRIKISGKTGKTGVKADDDVARIIDELTEGTLKLEDVKPQLKEIFDPTTATLTWMKNKRYFKEAVIEHYENKYRAWLEGGRNFKLIYINGPSGIGKTYFANKVARAINKARGVYEPLIHNAPNHTRNTRYDFLSGYENEIITVFDDLDAKTFDYAEFLNLFERDRVAKYSSRFRDKAWFAEVAIITKSETIEKWTKKLSYSDLAIASSAEKDNVLYQPRRRFSLIVDLDTTSVKFQVYKVTDKKTNKHELHTIDEIPFEDFHDEKTQSKIIKKILKLINLEEVKDEDIEQLDETTVESLKNIADLSKGVEVDV